jgi:uncharacterized protein (TIGR03790 family)
VGPNGPGAGRSYNRAMKSWGVLLARTPVIRWWVTASLLATIAIPAAPATEPAVHNLQAKQLAIVVNDADANSVTVAGLYQRARRIPDENVVHVSIPGSPRRLNAEEFNVLREQIASRLRPEIQALLLVWTAPYAVECNSITAALTLGFDAGQCKETCAPGRPSTYFDSRSRQPFTDHGIRISMLLPTDSIERAKSIIERGVASNFRIRQANAYFLVTSDKARSSRARLFPRSGYLPALGFRINTLRQDKIAGAKDIMLYQTGLVSVPELDTLEFLPGALADHLTSSGGDLLGTSQMSSLRWLDAGATASYGTVSEPCNHWQKFPHPQVLLRHYLAGETAIEAYWKSVSWPAQGLVIGEPLAAPYRPRNSSGM